MLGDVKTEIHTYEPQLLIYELEENMKNLKGSQAFNMPNNFYNNINQVVNNNRFNNIGFMPVNNWQQIIMQRQNIFGPMQMMQNIAINYSKFKNYYSIINIKGLIKK